MKFRADVHADAKNLALAFKWIKKIEPTSSLKDLIDPKSITGKDFSDYEELDMMMAAEVKWCYDIALFDLRNYRAWSRYKTKREKNSYTERKTEECFQWKTSESCSRRDACSFLHTTGDRETTWDEVEIRKKFSPRASILFSTESEEKD